MVENISGPKVVSVSSSSKKSGKSRLATFLVRELGSDYALKVSSGSHAPRGVITDEETISREGTDTGALVRAGARRVVWVNASEGRLAEELDEAMSLFGPGGTLVVEGNSALKHLRADFAVFVMTVPFDDFKDSAREAVSSADMVVVDTGGGLAEVPRAELARQIKSLSPRARAVFYSDEETLDLAMGQVLEAAREAIAR